MIIISFLLLANIAFADFPVNMTAGSTYTAFYDIENTPKIVIIIEKPNPTPSDFTLDVSLNENNLTCTQDVLEWVCENPSKSGTLKLSLSLNLALEPVKFNYKILLMRDEAPTPMTFFYGSGGWIQAGESCQVNGCEPGYECVLVGDIKECVKIRVPRIVNVSVLQPIEFKDEIILPLEEEPSEYRPYDWIIFLIFLLIVFFMYLHYKKVEKKDDNGQK